MKAAQTKRRIIRDDGPDPIDIYVGQRVREQRLRMHLSQGAVAKHFGLSFQSVQKYEDGSSRITASTLFRLTKLLDVEPNHFFEGYAEAGLDDDKRQTKGKR